MRSRVRGHLKLYLAYAASEAPEDAEVEDAESSSSSEMSSTEEVQLYFEAQYEIII